MWLLCTRTNYAAYDSDRAYRLNFNQQTARARDVMSTRQEQQLLEACERGELQTIRELVESKAVDPSRVVERHGHYCRGCWTAGWTPLHYACV